MPEDISICGQIRGSDGVAAAVYPDRHPRNESMRAPTRSEVQIHKARGKVLCLLNLQQAGARIDWILRSGNMAKRISCAEGEEDTHEDR